MRNRPVWFCFRRAHALSLALLAVVPVVCFAQETSPTPSPSEAEAEQVVVSATRFDIPLDQSPASVSVITSEDLEQKQIERVSNALREVPGLSIVQTGTAGQLTSIFTRGLRSEHTQVLLDGIPINQGLQGAFNFADFTTDDIERIANETLRIGSLFTYSVSDTGNPNTIFDPRPIDHFLTERWLIGPHIDWKATDWWEHKFIFSYDHERQINNPNEDGFVGPTRALFERTQVDYQNDLRPTSWLTLTSGFFYSRLNAGQERPFVLFGPTFVSDHTEEIAGFLQATVTPIENLIFVAGGRFDHFNQFGGVWTYRFAGSYKIDKTNTTLHSSVATGFSPPSSQDKIFGNNFGLKPERDLGWDIGVEQRLWKNRLTIGLTYFHNDLSNVIGFNCARNQSPILCSRRATLISKQRKLPLRTFRSPKARVCRAGRGTKFIFRLRIFGGKNCARRSKPNS